MNYNQGSPNNIKIIDQLDLDSDESQEDEFNTRDDNDCVLDDDDQDINISSHQNKKLLETVKEQSVEESEQTTLKRTIDNKKIDIQDLAPHTKKNNKKDFYSTSTNQDLSNKVQSINQQLSKTYGYGTNLKDLLHNNNSSTDKLEQINELQFSKSSENWGQNQNIKDYSFDKDVIDNLKRQLQSEKKKVLILEQSLSDRQNILNELRFFHDEVCIGYEKSQQELSELKDENQEYKFQSQGKIKKLELEIKNLNRQWEDSFEQLNRRQNEYNNDKQMTKNLKKEKIQLEHKLQEQNLQLEKKNEENDYLFKQKLDLESSNLKLKNKSHEQLSVLHALTQEHEQLQLQLENYQHNQITLQQQCDYYQEIEQNIEYKFQLRLQDEILKYQKQSEENSNQAINDKQYKFQKKLQQQQNLILQLRDQIALLESNSEPNHNILFKPLGVNSIEEYKQKIKILQKSEKFANHVTQLVISCNQEQQFNSTPTLSTVWKWLKNILYHFITLKADNQQLIAYFDATFDSTLGSNVVISPTNTFKSGTLKQKLGHQNENYDDIVHIQKITNEKANLERILDKVKLVLDQNSLQDLENFMDHELNSIQ